MTRAYRIVLAVALSGVASQHAWSWGNDGHKIVGAIALQFLSSDDRAEVQRLTRLYKTPDGWHYRDFPTALIFPDLARSKAKGPNPARKWRFFAKFNRWHFLNVPRDTDEVNLRHCGFDCVLRGIDWHLERLQKGNLEDWKRAEALFFLGHWVGDVHQPLHISYGDDLGGNKIDRIKGSYYNSPHLHSIWDTGIIKKARRGRSINSYARSLRSQITPALRSEWLRDEPLQWAQESYDIATQDTVDYCEWTPGWRGKSCDPEGRTRTLTASYQGQFEKVAERRLQQAGVRLAEYIRRGLKP